MMMKNVFKAVVCLCCVVTSLSAQDRVVELTNPDESCTSIAAGKLVFDGTPSELTQEKIHEIYQSNAQDLMLDMQGEAV